MSLQAVDIAINYRSESSDFVNDFFVPVLSQASHYDRAVGYFSSTALVSISRGLYPFIENQGKIRIIASPELSKEDYDAITEGYKSRDTVTQEAVLNALRDAENDEITDRLNLIAHLIASGQCEIKIAIPKSGFGIYHEKMGIIKDHERNIVSFVGSLNETASALESNFESIEAFCNWKGDDIRVSGHVVEFERLWNDKSSKVTVSRFETLDQEIMRKYLRCDRPIVNHDFKMRPRLPEAIELLESFDDTGIPPFKPANLKLHDYQKEAIVSFMEQNGRGIFDMATGTGKTYTALSAMTSLSHKLNNKLGVVIVVPYMHLIPQWVEDIKAFGDERTVCCSSAFKGWTKQLEKRILHLKGDSSNSFFCCVTTTATFAKAKFQALIQDKLSDLPMMIIADEAHNLGAKTAKSALEKCDFKYRLALSATLSRHHDSEGTAFLESYFGQRCIEYDLKSAIDGGFLTPYEYHPIFVEMSEDEKEIYSDLTLRIAKALHGQDENSGDISQTAKSLMIQRSRLIANVGSKVRALQHVIMPFVKESNILVYCGASGDLTNSEQYEAVKSLDSFSCHNAELFDQGDSQIKQVSSMLSNLGMRVAQFTSKEDSEQRQLLKNIYSDGRIQALVAIKCLDEGVNIVGIRRAFILASTTNPKEYIQRRGRVLRKVEGKDRAYIYDFIVLPCSIDHLNEFPSDLLKTYKRLIENETKRYKEFAELSINRNETGLNLYKLQKVFNLSFE